MYEVEWYKDLSDRLMKGLRLNRVPVAVFFSMEPPEGVAQLDRDDLKACAMLDEARFEGKAFYTAIDNHECQPARHILGFVPTPASAVSGIWAAGDYPEKGRAMTATPIAWVRQTLYKARSDGYHGIEPGTVKYVSYAPLDKCPIGPEIGGGVIVLICTPNAGMTLFRAATYRNGVIVPEGTTHLGSTCRSVMSYPYVTGKIAYTIGCVGGRTFVKVKSEELFFGFPVEFLEEIVDSMEVQLHRRPDIDSRLDQKPGEFHVATPFERKNQRPGWPRWTPEETPDYK